MATWTAFDAWTGRSAEVMVRGAAPPDATKYRVAFINNLTVTRTMDKATVLASEVSTSGTGYARQPYAPAAGMFDTTQLRYELPTVTTSFNATAAYQWSSVVLIADSGSANESLVMFCNFGSPQTVGAGATQPIQIDWAWLNSGNVNGV